jgi:hypothetical protein
LAGATALIVRVNNTSFFVFIEGQIYIADLPGETAELTKNCTVLI